MSWEPRIIKESFTWLEPVADEAIAYFYGRLFAAEPRLRALFPPAMDLQRDRLFHALTAIIWSMDSPGALAEMLGRLGRGHRRYGVLPEHYPAVGAALIATLRRFGGTAWTPETEAAWTAAYRTAAEMMIAAAARDAEHSPAWWVAEVTGHDRRADDLAVLALRPARPLPYEPGQYVPVQVARWPRIWRPYSLAGAPRPDGTLRLHVRAVPGGWVSGALVRHTRPGDSVLLGGALGGMTLDPGSRRDLLLVAGGTGLAPLKALAERVALSARDRDVHLVAAARTERDLYDLPDLLRLAAAYPRLRITPVISDDPSYDGPRGTPPDVLGRVPGLDEREVYVAGPVEMIRSTVDALQRLEVPPARIHHDLLEAEHRESGEPRRPAPEGGEDALTSPHVPAGTPSSPRPPDRTTRSPVPPR
ncbi:globin domain-containing protein [Spirillospora sp. CA-255316]